MNIIVLNGSPKGDVSVTMQYMEYIRKHFKEHNIEIINIAHDINKIERNSAEFATIINRIDESDGIIWAFPVYYLLVPSQYKRFIEMIYENGAQNTFAGKYAMVLTTSIHYHDSVARDYMNAICDDLKMNYVGDFLAAMDDLLDAEKRENLVKFAGHYFHAINTKLTTMRNYDPVLSSFDRIELPEFSDDLDTAISKKEGGRRIIILADEVLEGSNLEKMIEVFRRSLSIQSEVVEISKIGIKGGCLGCMKCGYDNRCSYNDGMQKLYFEKLQHADSVVFAGTVKDRFLSHRWKMFFDRSFFMGHTPFFKGKLHGAIISGPLRQNATLRQWLNVFLESRINNHIGIVSDEYGTSQEVINRLNAFASELEWVLDSGIEKPETYYSLSSRLIFRDFIYLSKGIFRADHRYYRKHRFYDFPQKNVKARFSNNLFLRSMMAIKPVREQIQRDMKQHMIASLKKAVESN